MQKTHVSILTALSIVALLILLKPMAVLSQPLWQQAMENSLRLYSLALTIPLKEMRH